MYTCDICFSDKELKAYIKSNGVKGDCPICKSSDAYRIDLLDFFQELIDNFRRTENGISLKSKIQENWSFFSSHDSATKILNFNKKGKH